MDQPVLGPSQTGPAYSVSEGSLNSLDDELHVLQPKTHKRHM